MLAAATDTEVEVDALHQVFEDAFGRIFRGEVESDDFNRLVVAARMPADEIVVLRAYAKYMRQIGFPLSQTFIEGTLAAHPDIATALVALFKTRFDPAQGAGAGSRAAEQQRAIEAMLEHVDNLSEDRVLRQVLALIQAMTRTNFWRRDAAGKPRTIFGESGARAIASPGCSSGPFRRAITQLEAAGDRERLAGVEGIRPGDF